MKISNKTCSKHKRCGKAFTLVELMTVVFIISVLMLLTAPVLRGIRSIARESKSKSNLKDFGVALNQFLTAYGGAFPGGGVGASHFAAAGQGDIRLNLQGTPRDLSLTMLDVTQRFYNAADYKAGGQDVDVAGFVQAYIGSDPEATFCPTADLRAFRSSSPIYKGEVYSETYGWQNESRISGYAMNSILQNGYREDFRAETIAFIERHVEISWGLTIRPNVHPSWHIRNHFGDDSILFQIGFSGHNPGDSPSSKPAVGERIDVAFNHRNGACYVAVDGRVGWISSNDIAVIDNQDNYNAQAARLWGLE